MNASQMCAHGLLLIRDSATGFGNTNMLSLVNEAMHDYFAQVAPRRTETASAFSLSSAVAEVSIGIYERIDFIRRTTSGATFYEPLRPAELGDILNRIARETTQAEPTHWAAIRLEGAVGAWRGYFHPIPDASYTYSVFGQGPIVDLVLTPSPTTADCTIAEQYWITRIAAARAAQIKGLSDAYVDSLWRGLPQEVQEKLWQAARMAAKPRVRPSEVLA